MKSRLNKQQWQALLIEQEQSGLSVAQFCRDKNLTAKNFYNQRSNKHSKANAVSVMPFVRAQIDSSVRNTAELTLNYGKVQLRLPTDASPLWLADLVVALA